MLAFVAHPCDLAVTDVPDRTFDVAQSCDPQAHRLDVPADRSDIDDVAHAVLVLEQHEDARQEVPDKILRAETNSDANHSGAGHDGREIDVQLAENGHERDPEHNHRRDAAQQGTDRLGALAASLQQHSGIAEGAEKYGAPGPEQPARPTGRGPPSCPENEAMQHRADEESNQKNQQNLQRHAKKDIGATGEILAVSQIKNRPAQHTGLLPACVLDRTEDLIKTGSDGSVGRARGRHGRRGRG